jgi:predicted  nucleic acid-binding Zn-ribbon protein
MLPELERLLILQEKDVKARTLRNELKAVPLERKALEEKLDRLKAQASDAKQRQRAAEVEQARLDTEIKSRKEQIAKYETQKLQTRKNEEYQALNHSIDHVRKEIAGIEDRQLELMEALEVLKPEVAAAEKTAAAAQTQVQNQIADLETKTKNLGSQLTELETNRPNYTQGLDEDLLDDYRRLFLNKTEAVVGLRQDTCNGCHMKVATSTVAAVRASQSVVHCDQCGRMLYLDLH